MASRAPSESRPGWQQAAVAAAVAAASKPLGGEPSVEQQAFVRHQASWREHAWKKEQRTRL